MNITITLEECIKNYEEHGMTILLNDGEVIGFEK